MYQCQLCGATYEKIQFLSRHISAFHDISKENYYRTYMLPFQPDAPNGICVRCGKSTRFERFRYYKYCSKDCERHDGRARNAAKAVETKRANGVYLRLNRELAEKQRKAGTLNLPRIKSSKTMREKGIYKIIGRKAADTMKKNGTYQLITQKRIATMQLNNTFNKSKSEDSCYSLLCNKYSDVKRNYKSNNYPFCCDFYIESLDLYIECNFHWTHGGHWFDENNKDDCKRLDIMKQKAITSRYYANAISVWTNKDLQKLNCAKANNLNYLVFWTEKDFNMYLGRNLYK